MNPFLYSTISSLVVISVASMAFIFSYQKDKESYSNIGLGLTGIAGLVLLYEIIRSFYSDGQLSSTSVLLACVLCWMTLAGQLKFQMKLAGILTLPLSILLLLLDLFKAPSRFVSAEEPFIIFRDAHIVTAILGQAMAIGAFSTALMYLWQHRNLKKKLIDQISDKVPALDKLSRVLNATLWLGLIFLSIALISGAYYTSRSVISSGLEFKIIWAIGVWCWYMAILVVKNVFKKPTTFVSKLSLIGFFILAVSLFGIVLRPEVGV
ncbi:cytochrome c biogenesis protein [bacterium]|nr:cytochrome c biogenesis protein [bacterium]